MIKIEGSYLEGGGQIVRTAVALSSIMSKSIEIINIRKGRTKPGLKNQHIHAIKALQKLCGAKVEGLVLGGEHLIFQPKKLKSKTLNIDIKTAGSITLLLQSLLIPCLFLDKKITLRIKGGTCTNWSMPVEFLENVLLQYFEPYCDKLKLKQEKRGYYPKGGGKIEIKLKPKFNEHPIEKINQGKLVLIKGISHASKSLENAKVAERQAKKAKELLKKYEVPIKITVEYSDTLSIGSGITLWAIFENEQGDKEVILGSDSLGARGKKSEIVGKEAAEKLINEIDNCACVDVHSADNLIPLMAFLPGSKIKVGEISKHTLTNIYTVEKFFGKIFEVKNNIITRSQQV